MTAAPDLLQLALTALFQVCVPAMSQGAIEQSYDPAKLVELSPAERASISVQLDAAAVKMDTNAGLIVINPSAPNCQVFSPDVGTKTIRTEFLKRLEASGGTLWKEMDTPGNALTTIGMLPTREHKSVVVLVAVGNELSNGFFGSTFAVEKKD